MRRLLPLAALALAVFVPSAARAEDDWPVVKDPSEAIQFRCPSGFEDMKSTVGERILTIGWPEGDWKAIRIEVNAYQWKWPVEDLVKSQITRLKGAYQGEGRHELLEGSTTRFVNIPSSESALYMGYTQIRAAGGYGYVMTLNLNKKLWESHRAQLDRVLDSFEAFEVAAVKYEIPKDWKEVQNEWFAVLGPVDPAADKDKREKQEKPLHMVRFWVDSPDGPFQWFRDMVEDKRKFMPRRVIRVYPKLDEFKAALGDEFRDGDRARYLHTHPDRPVMVLVSEDLSATREDVVREACIQYLETRTGPLPPWLRSGFREYARGAIANDYMGIMFHDHLAKAKELWKSRKAPKYADLLAMDDAALRALGKDGDIACWAFVHYNRHGGDTATMVACREFLQQAVKTGDAAAAWNATHEKENARKVDSAIAKWVKDEEVKEGRK